MVRIVPLRFLSILLTLFALGAPATVGVQAQGVGPGDETIGEEAGRVYAEFGPESEAAVLHGEEGALDDLLLSSEFGPESRAPGQVEEGEPNPLTDFTFQAYLPFLDQSIAAPQPARPTRAEDARAHLHADFDNDGFDDLAIGVPQEGVGGDLSAGAVHVLYGTGSGLSATGSQFWTQDSPNIAGAAESGDHFGNTLATGDFDNDGFDDLVIGAYLETLGTAINAGAFHVIYGTASGLSAAGSQFWTLDSPGVVGIAREADFLGASLIAGDFDDDEFDDLAVGAFNKDVGAVENAGAVLILYGSASGLTAAGSQIFTQDSPNIGGVAEDFDLFGYSLAAGDFDNDTYDDLAIGAAQEDLGADTDAGQVHILYGSAAGLSGAGSQLWTQDSAGIAGAAEPGDVFGEALAAGDFDDDGFDDLAIGAPREGIGTAGEAGALHILYGAGSGLSATGSQMWHQDTDGIAEVVEPGDRFGDSLSVGNFNNDKFDDLAVGAFHESIGMTFAGAVHVFYGANSGLSTNGDQLWNQNSPNIDGFSQNNDQFGWSVATGDYDNDTFADLTIGIPGKRVGGFNFAGAAQTIYGTAGGLNAAGNQVWNQNSTGIAGAPQESNIFGWALPGGAYPD